MKSLEPPPNSQTGQTQALTPSDRHRCYAGTAAILERSGAGETEPGIRSQVNRETAVLAEEDQSFTDRLIFWGTPSEYGTVVDPLAESRRIKENMALGRTITTGETPTIERKERALLEGLFN